MHHLSLQFSEILYDVKKKMVHFSLTFDLRPLIVVEGEGLVAKDIAKYWY